MIIIFAAVKRLLLDIPGEDVQSFEKKLFQFIDTRYPEIPEEIRTTKELNAGLEEKLTAASRECRGQNTAG